MAKKKPQAVDRNLTHQPQTDSDMEFVMENIEPDDELILNDLAKIDKAIQALNNLEDSITTQRPHTMTTLRGQKRNGKRWRSGIGNSAKS